MTRKRYPIPEGLRIVGTPRRARQANEGAAAGDDVATAETKDPCPVIALGHAKGVYHFLDGGGQHRELRPKDLNTVGIVSLFAGNAAWLFKAFPRRSEDGAVVGWNLNKTQVYLIKLAHDAGLFDPEHTIRGPGVWRDASGKDLIVHSGDALLLPGQRDPVPAGCRHEGWIYPATPPETRPAMRAASPAEAAQLHELLQAWHWRSPVHAPRLLLGWAGAAWICGALSWRPHVQVSAPPGTGKTTLVDLLCGLSGSTALSTSAATEAGIRQKLAGAARPVFVDENETDNVERAKRVIELARLASSDAQGNVLRGSADGKATNWPMRACFMFACVLHPRFRPQDYQRILTFEATHPPVGERSDGQSVQAWLRDEVQRVVRFGPGLRRRMVDGFGRFRDNLAVFESVIADLRGKARIADQLGTLLAAAETLLSDRVIAPEAATALVGDFAIPDIVGYDDESDDWECSTHLLSTDMPVPHGPGVERTTVGVLIRRAVRSAMANNELRRLGLTVLPNGRGGYDLAVANRHRALDLLFAGTPWAGAWPTALRRIAGARPSDDKVSFAGVKARATLVPLPALDLPDDDAVGPGDPSYPEGVA